MLLSLSIFQKGHLKANSKVGRGWEALVRGWSLGLSYRWVVLCGCEEETGGQWGLGKDIGTSQGVTEMLIETNSSIWWRVGSSCSRRRSVIAALGDLRL